jgi:hypothetical protein
MSEPRKIKVKRVREVRKIKRPKTQYGPVEFLGNNTLHFSLMDGTRAMHMQKLPHGCMMVSVANLGVSEGLFFLNPELVAVLKEFIGAPRVTVKRKKAELTLSDEFKRKQEEILAQAREYKDERNGQARGVVVRNGKKYGTNSGRKGMLSPNIKGES